MESAMETSEKMKEWRTEWETMQGLIAQLKSECEHFNVPMPEFDISELEGELSGQQESWG
jgi:hypothetical protein